MTSEFIRQTRTLKYGYVFFLVILLAVLIITQLIIQYSLDTTRDDGAIINAAGKQRTYSQRIAKHVYSLGLSVPLSKKAQQKTIDTLNVLAKKLKNGHTFLINYNISTTNSKTIKIQLTEIETPLNNICSVVDVLNKQLDTATINQAIKIIEQNELSYLLAMDKIVSAFENEHHTKHNRSKNLAFMLTVLSIVIILLGFFVIFTPSIRILNSTNKLLNESTQRLLLATQSAQIGIWEYDVETHTVIWDDEMYKLYNIPLHSTGNLIRKWMSRIHPEDRKRISDELKQALKGEKKIDSEFKIIWPDNSVHHISTKAAAQYNDTNKVIKIIGTNIDITNRHIAENELIESRENLAMAQQIAKLGSWEWDIITGAEKWSDEQYRIFGYEPGEVKADYTLFINALHPDDKEHVQKAVADALEGKKKYHEQFRIIQKNGTIKHIEANGNVTYDNEKKPVKMIGTVLDITERKRNQDELIKANFELNALFDAGNRVSTISTNLEGIITYFSKGAETLLGYTAEEMVGKETPAIIHLEEEVIERGKTLTEKYGRTIQGFDVFVEYARHGEYESREWTYKRKDGSTFPVQLVVTGMRNKNNELTGFLGIATDISWQKNKEHELHNSLNIIGEQNKRLLNFAHIVSHNLRSHAGNMELILDLYFGSETQEEKDEMVNLLCTISKSLNETIKNLNEVVSIQTNINTQRKKINLKNYIDDIINILSGDIAQKNGKVNNTVEPDIEPEYNTAYMESILLNLLSNGLKYSHPERPPVINISAKYENKSLVIKVADNGLGIDLKRYGDKLFGMYNTFHGNRDAKGIGLFITKNQVETMGGRIEVESTVGVGTTFKIILNQ